MPAADPSLPFAPEPTEATREEGTKRGTVTRTAPTRAQGQVARRVAEARATIPTWTAQVDVDLRSALAASDPDVEALDLVARASALALPAHPRLNGTWRDGRAETWSRVNVGVLVDVADGANLLAVTLYDADATPVADLAAARRDLEARAAGGGLSAPDTAAQTFVMAGLGDDGPDRFEVPPPPGIAAALSVGAVRERPWSVDGAVTARPVATLTLCADHRLVHPVHGAAFLGAVRALLECPDRL